MLPVLIYGKAPTPTLNGAKPTLAVAVNVRHIPATVDNRELSVTHMAATEFATNTAMQQQADNRAQAMKMLGAAALILLGFYLLDKKGR